MMKEKFTAIFDKDNDAERLSEALLSQGYVSNGGDFAYNDCNKLQEVDLTEVALSRESTGGYKNGMVDICNEVKDLLQKDMARVGSQDFATLVVNLINKVWKSVWRSGRGSNPRPPT